MRKKSTIGAKSFKALLFLLLLLVGLFLWQGERFLVVDNARSHNADSVVVLAGPSEEDKARLLTGVALIEENRARFLILPLRHKAVKWSWLKRYYGLGDGVSRDRVYIGRMQGPDSDVNAQLGGTFTEARKTIQIMLKNRLKSAIIVSSGYHMRRAKIAFDKTQQGHDLAFFYHPVRASLQPDPFWWRDKKHFFKILSEYKKLLAAFFMYEMV